MKSGISLDLRDEIDLDLILPAPGHPLSSIVKGIVGPYLTLLVLSHHNLRNVQETVGPDPPLPAYGQHQIRGVTKST